MSGCRRDKDYQGHDLTVVNMFPMDKTRTNQHTRSTLQLT
jgi:hypothetical protein